MEGTIKVTIGKYTCRCTYKITWLTNPVKTEANKVLAKEDKNAEKG